MTPFGFWAFVADDGGRDHPSRCRLSRKGDGYE